MQIEIYAAFLVGGSYAVVHCTAKEGTCVKRLVTADPSRIYEVLAAEYKDQLIVAKEVVGILGGGIKVDGDAGIGS